MLQIILKYFIRIFALIIIGLLLILPFELYKFNIYSEILPAFDLMIIFYLTSLNKLKYWHLFLIGIFIDQLYNMPIGGTSLILMGANYYLINVSKYFSLKDHYTNLIIFVVYSFAVILLRYLIVTIKGMHTIEGSSILFYYLTTIFSYPIMYIVINKSTKFLGAYVR